MDISVELAGLRLEHPLMNAAGTGKLLENVDKLARSADAAVMVGSITLEPRKGNAGNVYWADKLFSLNSLGLPNPGAEYYKAHIPEMAALAHGEGKPLFVSTAGFTVEEYAVLAEIAFNGGADAVELNLACPNVWENEKQKRIFCFDPRLLEEVLTSVDVRVGREARISVKLSPFSDPFALAEIAEAISHYEVVKMVTAINAFPNALCYDRSGKTVIEPAGGLAGLGGPALKPIGLGQVKQLRKLLPERIRIIGTGGIASAQDILDYQRAGADAVQVATAYLQKGEQVFSDLLAEML